MADEENDKNGKPKEKKGNFKIMPMQLYEKNRRIKKAGKYII